MVFSIGLGDTASMAQFCPESGPHAVLWSSNQEKL